MTIKIISPCKLEMFPKVAKYGLCNDVTHNDLIGYYSGIARYSPGIDRLLVRQGSRIYSALLRYDINNEDLSSHDHHQNTAVEPQSAHCGLCDHRSCCVLLQNGRRFSSRQRASCATIMHESAAAVGVPDMQATMYLDPRSPVKTCCYGA